MAGKGGLVGQHLLFQLQAPLCQPGDAFIGEFELLFQLGCTAAYRRKSFGGIVVHNRFSSSVYSLAAPLQPSERLSAVPHNDAAQWQLCAARGPS